MGWPAEPEKQMAKALSGSLYTLTAKHDGEVIGMGRLVGDGAVFWYLQDIFVYTPYQGRGIGTEIVTRLIAYAKENSIPGTEIALALMAAPGKEGFYERFGFAARPNGNEGAGMDMVVAL